MAARAVGAGFSAIAAGISQVRNALSEVRAQLQTATDAVRDASTSVSAAQNEASPQEVVGALSPAADKIDTTHREIAAASDRAEDVHELVARVLQVGSPGVLLRGIEHCRPRAAAPGSGLRPGV